MTQAIAGMEVVVLTWSPKVAMALVEIRLEGFSLGRARWVDEPTLMMLTGDANDPVLMAGQTYTREIA